MSPSGIFQRKPIVEAAVAEKHNSWCKLVHPHSKGTVY
jgi:hypothetical protein